MWPAVLCMCIIIYTDCVRVCICGYERERIE